MEAVHAALGWVVGGVAALVAELFTGTFVLLMVGGAALGAALAAAVGLGTLAWVVFVVLAPAGLWLVRPWAVRHLRRGGARTNVEALIGETAYPVVPFDPVSRIGRVKVGSVEWRAQLWEGAPVGDGGFAGLDEQVPLYYIQEVRGATLIVVPVGSISTGR